MKCTIVLLLLTLLHVHGSYGSNKQLIKENQEVAKEPRFLKLTRPDVKCDCPPECLSSEGWAAVVDPIGPEVHVLALALGGDQPAPENWRLDEVAVIKGRRAVELRGEWGWGENAVLQ